MSPIGDIAGSCYQLLRVARGIEECADLIVPEPFDHRVRDLPRPIDPALVEGELVDCEKSQRDCGVVLEESADARHAFLMRAHYSPLADHFTRQELSVSYRQPGEIISIEGSRGDGGAAEHEAVPGGENLLVAAGPDTPRPRVVENPPRPLENGVERLLIHSSTCRRSGAVRRHEENVHSFEVSAARYAVMRLESGGVGAEKGIELAFAPDVEFALSLIHISE